MTTSTVRRENTNLQGAGQTIAARPAGRCLHPVSIQPSIPPREKIGPVLLSIAQERLWFLDQINPGDASGTISDRKSVVEGKSVDLGGRRIIKKNTHLI